MVNRKYVDTGLLILRLVLGAIFTVHGSQKLGLLPGGAGIDGIVGMVKGMGFNPPVLWAWLLIISEFGGGLGILFGFLTPLSAFGIIVSMGVAIVKVHGPNGFLAPKGYEYPLALLGMAACLLLSGPGRMSLDYLLFGRRGRQPEEA